MYVKHLLISKDLESYIDKESITPTLATTPKEATTKEVARTKEWLKGNSKAQMIIMASLGPEPFDLIVSGDPTAYEMWKTLKT